MTPKQTSLFDTGENTPLKTAYENHRLFSRNVFEQAVAAAAKAGAGQGDEELSEAIRLAVSEKRPDPIVSILWPASESIESGALALRGKKETKTAAILLKSDPSDQAACGMLIKLSHKLNAPWGMISNGTDWRLFNASRLAAPEKWFDISLENACLDVVTREIFFSVLGPRASGKGIAAEELFCMSRAETIKIRTSLGRAARTAAEEICRGFIAAEKTETGAAPTEDALAMIYKHSLILTHRIIFALFAEARGILPAEGQKYKDNMAISEFAGRLSGPRVKRKSGSEPAFTVWHYLSNFFSTLHHGDEHLKIPCLGGALFSPEEHPFLTNNKIPDSFLETALSALALDANPLETYRSIDTEDIVSSLAGLTSLTPLLADQPMVLTEDDGFASWSPKKQVKWKKILSAIDKGDLFLHGKSFGEKIIPEHHPLKAAGVFEVPQTPAIVVPVGSGAALMEIIDAASIVAISEVKENRSLNELRIHAAKNVYGLDANPLNIDLARLAVWLFTVGPEPLLYLKHNIVEGTALCGAMPRDLTEINEGPASPNELKERAAEINEAWARSGHGLSSVRRRDAGFEKAAKKIAAATRPEVLDAAGIPAVAKPCKPIPRGTIDIWEQLEADSSPCTPNKHLPIQFPEVFFGGPAQNGFALIYSPAPDDLIATPEEKAFLKKSLSLKGKINTSEAVARRLLLALSHEGSLMLTTPARTLKSARFETLKASLEKENLYLKTASIPELKKHGVLIITNKN